MEPKTRRHPWRKGGTKENWRLTKPVASVLRYLARHKIARSSYIYAATGLHPKGGTLASMVDAGLIHKPVEQKEGQYSLGYPHIYALTPLGEEIAAQELKVKVAAHYFKGGEDFKHDIITADTIQSAELYFKERFVSWQEILEAAPSEDPFTWKYDFTHEGDHFKGEIIPDAILGVRTSRGIVPVIDETERKGKRSRTSTKQSSRRKKSLVYNYLDDHQVIQNKLGVKYFHVLFTLPTQEMVKNTLKMIDKELADTDLLLCKCIPMQTYENPSAPPPFPDLFGDPFESTAGPVFLNKW